MNMKALFTPFASTLDMYYLSGEDKLHCLNELQQCFHNAPNLDALVDSVSQVLNNYGLSTPVEKD